jgi:hypothetical protein
MSAAVGCVLRCLVGLAAAGISKFQRGRAGFPVADLTFKVLMLFTACTGVFIDTTQSNGGNWFIIVGAVCFLFWHGVSLYVRSPAL